MQNIPGTANEAAAEAARLFKLATSSKGKTAARSAMAESRDDKRALFAELFNEHTDMVEDELSMAPVTHKQKMLDSAADIKEEREEDKTTNAAGTKAPPKAEPKAEEKEEERNFESRMTDEDLDAVREDLKAYGMSDEEIAAIEDRVQSEKGLTWGQFVSTVAKKVAEARKAELSDEQKASLAGFFTKLGFTGKESAKLIGQLENGLTDKVLKQVEAKIDALADDRQFLFTKDEVEAFVSAMGLSKEFVAQAQGLFATNALPKDMKQAFTMIRQELAGMDRKDQKLVKAVGKAFASAMGDTQKASSAASQVEEAVDLKPRVAEENPETDAREGLAQAFRERKDAPAENTVRRQAVRSSDDKAEIKTETSTRDQADARDMDPETEHDRKWNNFVDQVREDGTSRTETAARAAEAKAGETKSALSQQTSAAEAKAKAWEKVSAPKVLKQVDQAVIKTLRNGAKQLTLQLTPENLGKLSIVLSVQGKEVSATIRTENSDAHKIITDNLHIIKNSLESQGLKVDKLDVQAGLADNQSFTNWFGESEHNLSREREAMIAMRNHMRSMRAQNGGDVAREVQPVGERVITSDQGLHLIA